MHVFQTTSYSEEKEPPGQIAEVTATDGVKVAGVGRHVGRRADDLHFQAVGTGEIAVQQTAQFVSIVPAESVRQEVQRDTIGVTETLAARNRPGRQTVNEGQRLQLDGRRARRSRAGTGFGTPCRSWRP